MIVLLGSLAHAAACCGGSGLDPTVLASCERFGVGATLSGDVTSGSWGWDGDWQASGGAASGLVAGTGALRLAPWLQAGLRVPLAWRRDPAVPSTFGLGPATLAARFEGRPGDGDALALTTSASTGSAVDRVPFSVAVEVTFGRPGVAWPWSVDGGVQLPVMAGSEPIGALTGTIGRDVGPARARILAGVRASPTGLGAASVEPRFGASVSWPVDPHDRVDVALFVDPPADFVGRNAPSQVSLSIDWLHVLS